MSSVFHTLFDRGSVKTKLIIYLVLLATIISIKEKDPVFPAALAVATFAAVLSQSLILRFTAKSWKITQSSVITGMITGYVFSSREALWKIALAACLAVFSRHLLVFRKKHLFNPAAFGIFLSVLILGASTQWKSTYMWYVIIPFGIYFTRMIKKTEIVIGYAVVFLALFGTQALLQKVSPLNVFGYFSWFYVFIMLIEPKTTPFAPAAKYFFGAGSAALVFVLTEAGVRFDAELFSLLLMNGVVPFLNRIPFNRGGAV